MGLGSDGSDQLDRGTHLKLIGVRRSMITLDQQALNDRMRELLEQYELTQVRDELPTADELRVRLEAHLPKELHERRTK
ncbi:MAG: hypothetical protein ACXAC5_02410 [Promethearchaeota archaeon]|jgi:DNA-binding transcriptional regulator YbjK